MSKFVECVPNFSEGKDIEKISKIVSAASSVSGVNILDVEKDPDHNRTVLTFIAPVENAVEAMFRAAKTASEVIDLNHHKGEHPRMGATDVAPFIPIMDTTVEECVALAVKLGERIGKELGIPVYLYDKAARVPERKDLAKVRKGQFEGLKEEIGVNPERTPDFGPNRIHPTAGATAVGARNQIVNFNVNLDTRDMEFCKSLAKKIRASGGGLPGLRAKEIFLESKGQVQISTVLTDYEQTSIHRALCEIRKEIEPRNIRITDTELIGLTAQKPLIDYATEELKVSGFNYENQVLENKILKMLSSWQMGASLVVDALSNTDPTPGGGSAAAISGAMGCGLAQMAMGITARGKNISEETRQSLLALSEKINRVKMEIQGCVAEDSASFDNFMKALKIPKESPERKTEMQKALIYAARVPLKTASLCVQAAEMIKPAGSEIKRDVMSDYKSAFYLLAAGARCALENVFINAKSIEDEGLKNSLIKEAENISSKITEAEKVTAL
ncbi:MAG: hypothetical protein Fur0012_08240 [Elusimicrobiota bacterium]